MIRNFILVTVASLMRKKIASLFTIFTIILGMTLIVTLLSFYNSYTGDIGPSVNRTDLLYVTNLKFKSDGEIVQRYYHKDATTHFISEYVKQLDDKATIGVYGINFLTNLGSRYSPFMVDRLGTDANFWKLFKFNFLKGRPYSQAEVEAKEQVCVLSEKAAMWLFEDIDVVGKTFTYIKKTYRVVGVISKEHPHFEVAADVYIPYLTDFWDESHFFTSNEKKVYVQRGRLKAVLLPNEGVSQSELKSDYEQLIAKLNGKGSVEEFDQVISELRPSHDLILKQLNLDFDDNPGDYMLVAVVVFFLLLPMIILSNINFYSLRDRFEEIGVRKAFGASRIGIVKQFIAENTFLTFVGVLFSIACSILVNRIMGMAIYHDSNMPGLDLSFRMLLMLVVGLLLFSFFTIIFPVWRVSKMKPIDAIQINQGNSQFTFKMRKKWLQVLTSGMLIFVLIIICVTLINYFETTKGLGFNHNNVVVVMVDEKGSSDNKSEISTHRNESHEYNKTRYKGMADAIRKLDGVESVSCVLEYPPYYIVPQYYDFELGGEDRRIRALETDDDFWKVTKMKIEKGKFYGKGKEGYIPAVVNQKAEREIWGGDALGKTFTRKCDGQRIIITGVIDTYKQHPSARGRSLVMMQRNAPSRSLAIRYSASSNMTDLDDRIDEAIKKWSGNSVFIPWNQNIQVVYDQDMEISIKVFKAIKLAMVLLLLNAFMGYFTLNYYNVRFRVKEFGLKRATGATKQRVMRAIIWENMKLVIWGAVIFSLILIQMMYIIGSNKMQIFWQGIALAFAIAIVLSFSTIIIPALNAIRQRPIEALSEE